MPPTTPPIPELPSTFTLDDVGLLLGAALGCFASYLIFRWLFTMLGVRLIAPMNPKLAAALEQEKFFAAIAMLVPVLVLAFIRTLLSDSFAWARDFFVQLVNGYIVVVIALIFYRLLNALEIVFIKDRNSSLDATIRKILHWLRIAIIAIAIVFVLSAFSTIEVTFLLAWVGILIATGSIVFGDMIYNAVARVILKERHLVGEGDWLEIPALQINGQVINMGPQLIKIQNWDNTLATVTPRYLLTNTFRNWQQMFDAGTRRILRYIYIDVSTVRPLDDELRNSTATLPDVAAYLDLRIQEFGSSEIALATVTNTALYRAYLMGYLTEHPKVSKERILRVTNEDAVGRGLPLLMVAYLTETQDIPYRLLDAEIYEHALAIAPRFGLRVYQSPSGDDLQTLRER